ncbi:MAG: iron-containing alcohol dehydrogenase [Acholeplasmataceae bacterium]|nr:iron-containing alcohol dehydrogenase [Acholeplasmataceae bacterium]HPT89346.1 iron-containing alcohol dehydrogenase [Bacilli bacterium]HQA19491.1 iron-containing alcohol dehydrogenase [Bacilli bacterium]HQD92067.1 iron-containing alcohol dehydrogenase [Bacilli bacterium]
MKEFIYYTPTKVFFGKGYERKVGEILKSYKIKKVLFHYGQKSIKETGLYDIVKESLTKAGISCIELGGVEPNPKISLVRKGVEICKQEQIELVLAVGGGSVIDSAKSIALGAKTSEDPWRFNVKEVEPYDALPVGVILTISAAGSEMSNSCVITNEELKLKRGFNHDLNRPLFAILNPELTYTVSKYQTACGIVDIMMHTLERYFSSHDFIELTDSMSLALLKAVKNAGLKAIHNPRDYEARATLMWASSLSHNGLTASLKNTYMPVHQLEHELSGMYDEVPHGVGLAILFPAWARLVYHQNYQKFARLGVEVFDVNPNQAIEDQTKEAINNMEIYFKTIGMPTKLRELNIPNINIIGMANSLTKNKTFVYQNAFTPIDFNFALEVYRKAY